MSRMTNLIGMLFLSGCVTAPVPLMTLLETPARYDGKRMTVTAFVMETGPHGTLLVDDPNRPRKVMALRIDRPSAIRGMDEMIIMMTEDETREIALGVKAEFTGVIKTLTDRTQVLVLESVRNLRWGAPPTPRSVPRTEAYVVWVTRFA